MPNTAKERRFFRGGNASIVWDPRNNCALCDLSEGHVTTSDEYTIKVLKSLGYEQIPLGATEPPPRRAEVIQPLEVEDVKGIPKGISLKGAAMLQEDEHGPEVTPPKKPKLNPEDDQSSPSRDAPSGSGPEKPGKKKVKRSLKRRLDKKGK